MGKTTLMTEIVMKYLIKSVRRCFAVCPTWYQQPALAPLRRIKGAFPRNRVSQQATEQTFEAIFYLLNTERLKGRRIPTLLIVDDCAAESSLNKGNHGAYGRLAIASPHLNLSICTVVQKMVSASPLMRENTEGVIAFIPSRVADIDIIVDEYNPFPFLSNNRKLLLRVLEKCWRENRYTLIWREPLTGKTAYYAGLQEEITFPREDLDS
jgi:hypothetical protein